MSTAANLLLILLFLASVYTLLGLLCAIAENAQQLAVKPYQRRRARQKPRRRSPRRAPTTIGGSAGMKKTLGATPVEKG